jgi:hypothetical protein
MDVDRSSDEEDFEGFNVRPAQTTAKQILETVKAAPADYPLTKLQENEIEEWIEIDKGAEVTETITDEQIIDSVVNPEKSKVAEDCEEQDLIVEQEKVSWNTAEQYIQGLIKFMEQSPNFSAQEVVQAHALRNVLIKKKQICFKQADIRTLFKRVSEKAARISKENLATPTTSTSDIADLPEEEVDDVSAPSETAPRTPEGQ